MNSLFRPIHWPFLAAAALLLSGCVSNPFRGDQAQAPEPVIQQQPQAERKPVQGPIPSAAPDDPQETTDNTVPAAPRDLWRRIANGYAMDITDHPRLQREMDWLRSHPNYLLHASERASPYLYYVVEKAEARGLPLELALLPIVESGFNPQARSRFDAAGLWQFMPPTGQAFGLKQNWWYDGRFDIAASTGAAFDYLEQLAAQFDGNWALALSAYNAGPGTVRRAIARNRAEGLPVDYWSLDLPRETSNYVPRLLAVARAVQTPSAYGITLATIPDKPRLARVELPRQIELRIAAELADLDPEQLLVLNPCHQRWATHPDGPHDLLLPVARAQTFSDRLNRLDDSAWVRTQRHRIRPGDSLVAIARHYGTSVNELKKLNKLRSTQIRAGKYLLIPSGPGHRLAGTNSPASKPTRHLVQPGDTLWEIARTHGLNYRQLAALNGLAEKDTLRPGQELQLAAAPDGQGPQTVAYQVRSGDSLYVIARRFGVRIADLRRWNRFDGPYLQPGQTLTLHLQASDTSQL